MGNIKAPKSQKTSYCLPKEDYITAVHYALRYPTLLADLPPADSGSAIRYDKERVQTSNQYDATAELAMKRLAITQKLKIIEDTILEVAPEGLEHYLKLGVCYGFTYDQLLGRNLPMGRNQYYDMRRHFYFNLIQKI